MHRVTSGLNFFGMVRRLMQQTFRPVTRFQVLASFIFPANVASNWPGRGPIRKTSLDNER